MKRIQFQFEGFSGIRLFAQSWYPEGLIEAILIVVHGIGEHSGRYERFAEGMIAKNFGVLAFDLRGHGNSPGQRGHIESWEEYRKDLDNFLHWTLGQNFDVPIFMFGHSMGALIVADFILSKPDHLSGVVLSGLPIEPIGVGNAFKVAIARIMTRVWPTFSMESDLDTTALSRDSKVIQAYETDPLIHKYGSVRLGTEGLSAIQRVITRAGNIELPILMLHGGEDRINSISGALDFFQKISSRFREFRSYEDSFHELHNDLDHEKVISDLSTWIGKHTKKKATAPGPVAQSLNLIRQFDTEKYPSGWSIAESSAEELKRSLMGTRNTTPNDSQQLSFQEVNRARFRPGLNTGHYESYFQRANHPTRPLAFWIRYTIFSPRGKPRDAKGQLWAIYFDGEKNNIIAVKEEFPIQDCVLSRHRLGVGIGSAFLDGRSLEGIASQGKESVAWKLSFEGNQKPLFLLPKARYDQKFPAAKALVGLPLAKYNGNLRVNDVDILVENWVGSQNHNWGPKHTDQYAWGQVAGFDNYPDAFLECATVRLKVGPLWTPRITNIVLRLEDQDYSLNTIFQGLRATGKYDYFSWHFQSGNDDVMITGKIEANKEQFVGLYYENPTGGRKTCLNTKIGKCRISLEQKGRRPMELYTESRAAFEIITEDKRHGVSMMA